MGIKLVVFDVDGTLTRHSSIWWRLHEAFGTEEKGRMYYDRYFAGEIDYNTWADLDAGLWKGRSLQDVMDIVNDTELTHGAEETVHTLRENGFQLAILSGGLDVLVDSIAKRLGISFVLTNNLLHEDGILTGEVESHVGWGDKIQEINKICEHFDVSLEEIAYIGDGRNDMSVFSVVGLSIAFNPEYKEVEEAAIVTIREDDLTAILPHIIGGKRKRMNT